MQVQREVDIEAPVDDVWEALVTEDGRESWLQDEQRDRDIHIEVVDFPHRLVWWWLGEDEPATRVEFELIAHPRGTRVIVRESAPSFPLAALAHCLAGAPA
jgi:uncharacterized protein YndB with AHSA1/START domain